MASIVATPGTSPSPTINLSDLEQKIREGLKNIQTISRCPLFWNGSKIVDNKEYKKGDQDDKYKDIIKRCLDVSDDIANALYCRDHIYKTKDPAKAAHGKIFEDNFNQALSCAFIPVGVDKNEFLQGNKIEKTSDLDEFKTGYHLKSKIDYEIPIFQYYPLPQLEWQHDPLDFAVKHFADINTPIFDMREQDEGSEFTPERLREMHHLHYKMNYSFAVNPEDNGLVKDLRDQMSSIMGTGLNIKYSAGNEKDVEGNVWFPNKAEMADFRNFWNDTHHRDDWMKGAEGDFEVLPFVGVWGVWNDVTISEDTKYKCGKGVWLIDFSFHHDLDKLLWGNNPNKTKKALSDLSELLVKIKELSNTIKTADDDEQDNVYREALALWYGETIPTGTGGRIIMKDKGHYNRIVKKNYDDEKPSLLDLYNGINSMIEENGGVLKLNQKVFSWKSGKWRPERVQVGFIPSKIKDFLKSMALNRKAVYIPYDKNTPGHSRLFIPIKFTRIDFISKKVGEAKKAVIKKISVKTLKTMFKLTKISRTSPGGWHKLSYGSIKLSNIDHYIGEWNEIVTRKVSENDEFNIFLLYEENITNDRGIEICTNIANNLHLLIPSSSTGKVGGQKGGNKDIDEHKKYLEELIDIKNNLEDIDVLLDDIEIPDGEKLYDIENELNKYNYIMEKEVQYGGDENAVLVIEDILKNDKEKLYEKQIDDIQFLVDVSIEETESASDMGLKDMITRYDNLLKGFFKHMRELTEDYNEHTSDSINDMLEAYCHWRHQTEFNSRNLNYRKHYEYMILKDISIIESKIYDIVNSLKIHRKRGEKKIKMNPELVKKFIDDYGYYGKICIYVTTEGSEFIENIYQKFDNLLAKRVFNKIDVDLKWFCNFSGMTTRQRRASSLDVVRRLSTPSPSPQEQLMKENERLKEENTKLQEELAQKQAQLEECLQREQDRATRSTKESGEGGDNDGGDDDDGGDDNGGDDGGNDGNNEETTGMRTPPEFAVGDDVNPRSPPTVPRRSKDYMEVDSLAEGIASTSIDEEAPADSWYGRKILEARARLDLNETLGDNWIEIWRDYEKYVRENFGEDIFKTPNEVDDPTVGKPEEMKDFISLVSNWVPNKKPPSSRRIVKPKRSNKKKVKPKSKFQQGTVIITNEIQNKFIKRLLDSNINNTTAQGYILEDFVDDYNERKPKADSVERLRWSDDEFIDGWIENMLDTDYLNDFYEKYPYLKGGKRKKKKKKTRRKRKKKKKKTRTKK